MAHTLCRSFSGKRCTSTALRVLFATHSCSRFDLILTDDPTNWPWHAFINLPLVPLSLVAARTRYFDSFPIFPLYLAWTTSPVAPSLVVANSAYNPLSSSYQLQPLLRWPPSPIMVSICLPLVTRLYHRLMRHLRHWVLGPQPAEGLPLRRIELALNEGGPALNIRIAANMDADNGAEGRAQGEAAPAAAAPPDADDNAVAAEQTVRLTGTSLGRFIGGALMIPKLSNWMGTLLFNLSQHARWLRAFLGVRPPLRLLPYSVNTGAPRYQSLGTHLRVLINMLCGGTKVWADADPVWCVRRRRQSRKLTSLSCQVAQYRWLGHLRLRESNMHVHARR